MAEAAAETERQAFLNWREDGTSERATLGGRYGGAVGINHVVLSVRDMEASHDFYTRVWRLEHCGTQGGPDSGRWLRFYRSHGNTHHDLALTPVPDPDAWPLPDDGLAPRSPGLNHFAWTYTDIETWKQQARHIVESGWPVEFRMEHGMSHSIYVRNPDGFITEALFEFPREYWIDNIEAALHYRRIITPDEADYLDPVEGDYPRFTADGIENRTPDGRKLA